MNHYGVILRHLRLLKKLHVKEAAALIGRSTGWLSEVENSKGAARIDSQEFNRIVTAYGGEAHRKQFGIWVARAHKPSPRAKDISFDGSVLRYLRKKAKFSIAEAAQEAGISSCYLSYLETGVKRLSLEQRDKFMRIYGYSPSSFRNFTTVDKRAKNVPTKDKLGLLLKQMSGAEIQKIFEFALSMASAQSLSAEERAS
jgi:transcriptional regulator with XRE-family HTH domain